MRGVSKSYASCWCATQLLAAVLVGLGPGASVARAQLPASNRSPESTCANLLADTASPGTASGPTSPDSARVRSDTVQAGIGGARTGAPDILLIAAIHADEVRFASQPRVRVRLCWGGDTLRVVARQNLPSPVVAGTTYRNVYVAVELLGRLNAECLVDRISTARTPVVDNRLPDSARLAGCAFLGARAAGGQQPPRSP